MRTTRLFAIAVLISSSCPALFAQEILWKRLGDSPEDDLGRVVRFAGDIDGDGSVDLFVGLPWADCAVDGDGMVLTLRGADGTTITSVCGEVDSDFADALAGGIDVDSDGVPDLIVTSAGDSRVAPNAGACSIYSGANDFLLREHLGLVQSERFGRAVDSIADLDGDGARDYVVSSPGDASTARVTAYSGASGSILYEIPAPPDDDGFGLALADAGDVDADGIHDILIGNLKGGASPSPGMAWVYSGADGSNLFEFEGEHPSSKFGESVDGIGDVNGDGHSDFIIGSPGFLNILGNNESGRAYVYSGIDGSLLYFHDGLQVIGDLGTNVRGIGDMNRDAVPDYLVYRGGWVGTCDAGGAVNIYSGRTGLRLYHFESVQTEGMSFSDSYDGGADLDGDGRPELVIGLPYNQSDDVGAVYVFSMNDFYCDAEPKEECAGYDVKIRMGETHPGNLIGLALAGIDGTPTFAFLAVAPADATGRFEVGGKVPSGLSGHFADFQSFAVGLSGRIVTSAAERFYFRP